MLAVLGRRLSPFPGRFGGVREPMDENLTKRGSPRAPVRKHTAKSGSDDKIHLVDAAPIDMVDPSLLRTRCGAAVLEIYNTPSDVTCERCTEADGSSA